MEQLEFSFTFKHHTFRRYNIKRMVLNALKNKVIPAFQAVVNYQLPKIQFSFPFPHKKLTILGIEFLPRPLNFY